MSAINSYVLTITATDRPGLLSVITNLINRKLITIDSISAARTEVRDIVYITIELKMESAGTATLARQVGKIIEIMTVDIRPLEAVCSQRTSLIRVSSSFLNSDKVRCINNYGVKILYSSKDEVVLQKTGSEAELALLYDLLDKSELIGYHQSGLMTYNSKVVL